MAGVYIPNMEMPTRCYDCDLCYDMYYCKAVKESLFEKDGESDRDPAENRMERCPLIPITSHGRLIEAEAVKDIVSAHDYPLRGGLNSVDNGMWTIGIFQAIDEAPTVVPSDEKKEKTEKYDALQTAIKFTIEAYKHRCDEADKNYQNDGKFGNIAAYNKGIADAYRCVIADLERWNE